MHILVGLFLVVIGAAVTIKNEWMLQNFGRIQEAEKYLGFEGGSRLAYKIIGIGLAILGFIVMTNLWETALLSFVRLLGGQK